MIEDNIIQLLQNHQRVRTSHSETSEPGSLINENPQRRSGNTNPQVPPPWGPYRTRSFTATSPPAGKAPANNGTSNFVTDQRPHREPGRGAATHTACSRRRAPPDPGTVEQHEPDELRVADHVASGEPARILSEPVEPLEAEPREDRGRAAPPARTSNVPPTPMMKGIESRLGSARERALWRGSRERRRAVRLSRQRSRRRRPPPPAAK